MYHYNINNNEHSQHYRPSILTIFKRPMLGMDWIKIWILALLIFTILYLSMNVTDEMLLCESDVLSNVFSSNQKNNVNNDIAARGIEHLNNLSSSELANLSPDMIPGFGDF
jgi:hypothetical protein